MRLFLLVALLFSAQTASAGEVEFNIPEETTKITSIMPEVIFGSTGSEAVISPEVTSLTQVAAKRRVTVCQNGVCQTIDVALAPPAAAPAAPAPKAASAPNCACGASCACGGAKLTVSEFKSVGPVRRVFGGVFGRLFSGRCGG